MKIIETKSFELATISRGDINSPKIALLLPGQLDTKDYAHMANHVDFLANKGYYALSFDPPGTWDSPGSIDLYTMTNYAKAINELIEFLGNRPTVLMGHSRGGSMAMLVGPDNQYVTHIIAVMSNIAPSKLQVGYSKDEIKENVKISYRDMPPNDKVNKKRFDLPLNYFKDAAKYNIIDGLKNCSKPKLFFYGTEDILVKPESVKATYDEVIEPKAIHELKSDHDYRYHKNIIEEVNNVVWDFLSW